MKIESEDAFDILSHWKEYREDVAECPLYDAHRERLCCFSSVYSNFPYLDSFLHPVEFLSTAC